MSAWIFRTCPFCGGQDIIAKSETIGGTLGYGPAAARKKIWAECNYCGARSGHTIADVIGDKEVLAAAIEKWNRRI